MGAPFKWGGPESQALGDWGRGLRHPQASLPEERLRGARPSDTQQGHFSQNNFRTEAALNTPHSCYKRRRSQLNFNTFLRVFSGKKWDDEVISARTKQRSTVSSASLRNSQQAENRPLSERLGRHVRACLHPGPAAPLGVLGSVPVLGYSLWDSGAFPTASSGWCAHKHAIANLVSLRPAEKQFCRYFHFTGGKLRLRERA